MEQDPDEQLELVLAPVPFQLLDLISALMNGELLDDVAVQGSNFLILELVDVKALDIVFVLEILHIYGFDSLLDHLHYLLESKVDRLLIHSLDLLRGLR